ncbi:MAG: ATP-binding protein [Oscillospiraceae bacterium]|nr:ATP-binding protein [Oscillospiraceae bacterium]
MRGAQFHLSNVCVEDIEYLPDHKLDKSLISKLATCPYIQEKHNIIILSATGAGKPYLGYAFGITACRQYL